MLKERIVMTKKGFQINEDLADPGRKAFFTTFNLKDEKVLKNDMKKLTYYTVLNTTEQQLENRTFVCVWEMKDGKQVEEYVFYFSTAGASGAKPRLQWSITKAKKYGENAYMITLKWKDHLCESIHKRHIWLFHKKSKKKFVFMREQIAPLDSSAGEPVDQYIIELPPGVSVDALSIEGDDLLKQKYLLTGV